MSNNRQPLVPISHSHMNSKLHSPEPKVFQLLTPASVQTPKTTSIKGRDLSKISGPGILTPKETTDVDQKVKQLKLRLKVAYYKVMTNQTDKPFSELALQERKPVLLKTRKSSFHQTPMKKRKTEDFSSPLKGMSTPGSMGAAKSLLQLSTRA